MIQLKNLYLLVEYEDELEFLNDLKNAVATLERVQDKFSIKFKRLNNVRSKVENVLLNKKRCNKYKKICFNCGGCGQK
jgi:hypothetical protein